MRVKDLLTGNIIEVSSEIVIDQFKKHSDRYKEIMPEVNPEQKKTKKK